MFQAFTRLCKSVRPWEPVAGIQNIEEKLCLSQNIKERLCLSQKHSLQGLTLTFHARWTWSILSVAIVIVNAFSHLKKAARLFCAERQE